MMYQMNEYKKIRLGYKKITQTEGYSKCADLMIDNDCWDKSEAGSKKLVGLLHVQISISVFNSNSIAKYLG